MFDNGYYGITAETRKIYHDRQVLNREDFELMLLERKKALKYGWTKPQAYKRFIRAIISNIHKIALEEDKLK